MQPRGGEKNSTNFFFEREKFAFHPMVVSVFCGMVVGLAACVCGASGREPPGKPDKPTALADLGPNFQWNCHTAGGGDCHNHPRRNCQEHAGHCAKINRTQASFELIDALDIGVVTDFLPDAPARAILEQMKTLPDRCAGRREVCARARARVSRPPSVRPDMHTRGLGWRGCLPGNHSLASPDPDEHAPHRTRAASGRRSTTSNRGRWAQTRRVTSH